MDPNAVPNVDPTQLIASLGITLVFALAAYLAISWCLMTIARKTSTPNGWMAFIPILNLVLMCQIARKPGWWVLLLFIPLVNLIIGVIVWMAIAEVRGKPPWTGLLILVPLVNFVIPFYLAAGEAGGPATAAAVPGAASTAPGAGAPPPPPPGAPSQFGGGPLGACPQCGAAPDPDELFCGECGHRLEPAQPRSPGPSAPAAPGYPAATAAPAKSSSSAGPMIAVIAILLIAVLGIGGYLLISGRTPTTSQPKMAQALAGTLTEFPVDTDAASPARPTQVVTQKIDKGSSRDDGMKIPPDWLPPGIDENMLDRTAESVTAATYRTNPKASPVNVHVVDAAPGVDATSTYAGQIAATVPDAQQSGVEVKSPQGEVYRGYKVRSPEVQVFVLGRQSANTIVIIYAPDPEGHELSERLAANVGNGEGLNDYPEMQETLWRLPAEPPAGLSLEEVGSYNTDELISEEDWQDAMGSMDTDDGKELITKARQFVPRTITTGRYQDASRNPYDVILGNYGGPKAMFAWLALRVLFQVAEFEKVPLSGGDCYSYTDGDDRFMLMRRGGHLGLLRGPGQAQPDVLTALAASLQI